MAKPIEFYPNKNGFYAGTDEADIFIYERGLVTLYLNGMNKPTKDTDDILRIKDKQKSEIRLFRQNTNLIIKFENNYKDVITIMELFSGNQMNGRTLTLQEEIF